MFIPFGKTAKSPAPISKDPSVPSTVTFTFPSSRYIVSSSLKDHGILVGPPSHLDQVETPSSVSLDSGGFFCIFTPNTSRVVVDIAVFFGKSTTNKRERSRGMKITSDKRCTRGFITLLNCCFCKISTQTTNADCRVLFHFEE
uniref:Uncharacterized protein n=1 Tax=Lotus japonicus TaxID=34305 RepID=I3SHN2_LOTJA|nr:unknown [Lotus japonicus]